MDRIESYGKIDLHLHLDGSLPAETILGLARKDHIELAADTEEGLRPYLTARADCEDLNEYLRCFDIPLMVLQTAENLRIASCELGRDLEEKGLSYAEVRFAPQLHVLRGLTQEEAVQAVLDGFGQVMEERRGRIRLKAILCCMRGKNCTANMETVLTAARFLGKGVVAADLAGAEGLYPTRDFEEEFTLAGSLGVPFTIHAGEADGPDSVRWAIEMGARRIGHGVRAVQNPQVLALLKERHIPLELCPTSNRQTRAVTDMAGYPLRQFLTLGIPVTVNTDDMAICRTTVAQEFAYLRDHFSLTPEEETLLYRNAVEAAFTNEETRQILYCKVSKS